jgi:hypothetical protein
MIRFVRSDPIGRVVGPVLLVALTMAAAACSSGASATPGSGEASQAATASLAPAESGSAAPSGATAAAGSPQGAAASGGTGSSGGASTSGGAGSSAAPSASAPAAAAASPSGPLALAANICDMLDQATIERITGLKVGPGQTAPVDKKTYLAGCNWLEGTSYGFQLSSQTEAKISSEIAHPPSGYKRVAGVGTAAMVATSTLFYTKIKEVSLIVNEGTFGLVFGLTGPKATVAQDVALAKAVK